MASFYYLLEFEIYDGNINLMTPDGNKLNFQRCNFPGLTRENVTN